MESRIYNMHDMKRLPDCVYIGRAGHGMDGQWGNPFTVDAFGRIGAVKKYELMVRANRKMCARMRAELTGKNLVCFCAPGNGVGLSPDDSLCCHGQVILRAIRGDYDL